MQRSKNQDIKSRKTIQEKLAELRRLKAAGKTRLESYKIQDEDQLYDLVDDEKYRSIVMKRLNEDDFVVDDHGEGYVDNGIENWEMSSEEDSSEKEEIYKEKNKKKYPQNEKINQFFKKKIPTNSITQTTEEELDFMAGILGEIDNEELKRTSKKASKSMSIPRKRLASPSKNSTILNRLEKANSIFARQKLSKSSIHSTNNDYHIQNQLCSDAIPSDPPSKIDTPSSSMNIPDDTFETKSEEENEFVVKQLIKHDIQQNKTIISNKLELPSFTSKSDPIPEITSSPILEKINASQWLDVNKSLNITSSPEVLSYSGKKENPDDFIEEDGSLKMFWLDYTELNNTLCLFGKVFDKKSQKYLSCFLQIHGIMRNLYFLPRDFKLHGKDSTEEVTMTDVYEEVSDLLAKFKINEFKSKPTSRKYVFEFPDVPHQCDYLKVLYPYTKPSLPQDISGNTFSRIFGTNTPLFEQFVLYKRIMGPCWLHIKEPQFTFGQNFSWCKLELGVINPECISPVSDSKSDYLLPPLTLMSIALRKIMNHKENKQEIVVISARIYENILLDDSIPANNLPCRSGIFVEKLLASGRLICDLANELGRSLIKAQSWTLSELCRIQLGIERYEIDEEKIMLSWIDTAKGMMEYIIHCEVDTYFIAAIVLKVQILPLTKQLTNIAGNNWARTLTGTRAERNEYILLHEFHREKYICPDKSIIKSKMIDVNEEEEEEIGITTSLKKKDKYKGGLVFEPIKGLYDKYILVMDFNSLYPSIIQEYNICFTTIDRHECEDNEKIPELPDEQVSQGILPKLIETLVNRRKQIKNLIKDKNASPIQKMQWDIKQQALKLTANSMYGCLGYTKSRFYARPLAVLITYKGREVLRNTKELAENLNLQVIYGDTDSVMINTNVETFDEAMKIGNEFKKHVNKRYKLLEIDIDNVYQRMLLHAKKKYAALHLVEVNGKMEPKIDIKGLDMKRREYCVLAKEVSSYVLDQILLGKQTEFVVEKIHDYLRDFANRIRIGDFHPTKFIIYNKLGKNPEDYPNGKSMPHVQVALKKKAKGDSVKINDVIGYIITGSENENKHVAERACLPQEVIKSSDMKIDYTYYLTNQILPPIERLCGPIEGTDRTRLAECLGLDIRKYQINEINNSGYKISTYESNLTDDERFKNTGSLILTCNSCHEKIDFKGLAKSKQYVNLEGIFCPCGKKFPIYTISAQLESQIRNYNSIYYNAWILCNDPSCANRTRQIGVYGKRCSIKNCQGQMYFEYSDKMLYTQLLYYDSLFNVDKAREIANQFPEPESILICAEYNRERFEKLRYITQSYLSHNKRRFVDLYKTTSNEPFTPPSQLLEQDKTPNKLQPLKIKNESLDNWNDLTPIQITNMTPEEIKEKLLHAIKHIDLLQKTLKKERASIAHHTLQYNLLTSEFHKVQQSLAEITRIQHETDHLLLDLNLPTNTYTACQRHCETIQQLRKIQEKKQSTSTKVLLPESDTQNSPITFNSSNTESHSNNTLSNCHHLMSPISFRSAQHKRQHHTRDKSNISSNTLKRRHLITRKYSLRSDQSLPISPSTSPMKQS
ncbi:hypothetical protein PCK1_000392 [Pneumocystis canis]|nr:hypothetical protein PCK1_000392 [Pneumocystis canis]